MHARTSSPDCSGPTVWTAGTNTAPRSPHSTCGLHLWPVAVPAGAARPERCATAVATPGRAQVLVFSGCAVGERMPRTRQRPLNLLVRGLSWVVGDTRIELVTSSVSSSPDEVAPSELVQVSDLSGSIAVHG